MHRRRQTTLMQIYTLKSCFVFALTFDLLLSVTAKLHFDATFVTAVTFLRDQFLIILTFFSILPQSKRFRYPAFNRQ